MTSSPNRRNSSITRRPENRVQCTEVIEDGGVRDNSNFHMDSVWGKVGIEPTPGGEYYLNMNYTSASFGAAPSLYQDQIFLSPGSQFSQLWNIPAYINRGADLSGQQKVNDWVTLKGKLFYHYHEDLLESFYDPNHDQQIARSEYKDNTIGGNILDEMNLASNDTLRANFLYRRDDHQQRAVAYLPFQEDVSYTGSFGLENQWNPVKPLSIVARRCLRLVGCGELEPGQHELGGGFHGLFETSKPRALTG